MLSGISAHWLPAFKLALPWLILLGALNAWALNAKLPMSTPPAEFKLDPIDFIELILGFLAASSIAVSWNRFILLDSPFASEPSFRMDRIVWTYFGKNILIYAICLGPLLLLALVSQIVSSPLLAVLILALFIQVLIFINRMSVSLPAIAIGKPTIGLKEALEVTRGNNLRILGLLGLTYLAIAIAFFAYLTIISILSTLGVGAMLVGAVIFGIPMQFFSAIINATLLTSLYGFFVEKRDF